MAQKGRHHEERVPQVLSWLERYQVVKMGKLSGSVRS